MLEDSGIGSTPSSVKDLLDVWMLQFRGRQRGLVTVGVAALCWSIWRCRNDSYFKRLVLKEPTNILFSVCHWVNFWVGLQKEADRDKLRNGASRLSKVVSNVSNAHSAWREATMRDTN